MADESSGNLSISLLRSVFKILLGVHHSCKTQLLILLIGIYPGCVRSWIKMSWLTVQWLGMSSLQSKCIKLVWMTQSTHSHCNGGMKDSWHLWERWPYWFKFLYKWKLMHGKWMYCMSPLLRVFEVISPHANLLILKALQFSCIFSTSEITVKNVLRSRRSSSDWFIVFPCYIFLM